MSTTPSASVPDPAQPARQALTSLPGAPCAATPDGRGGPGTAPPARKPRVAWKDALAFHLARCALATLQTLPGFLARALGRWLGRALWLALGRHRRQVLRHLELAFRGDVPPAQKRRWCRMNFEHLGLSVVEFARLNRLTRETLGELVDCSELQGLEQLQAAGGGKGLLLVPAHHGNWELAGYAVSLLGFPLHSVARPLDNPRLNSLIQQIREGSGNVIIEKWQVLWRLKKLLDQGAWVGITIDQNGGVAGHFTPLFGVPASTITSPADLHLATGAPIVILSLNRQADGLHHKFHLWEVIRHPRSGEAQADKAAIMRRINAAYERAICAYPEQWLWGHRRWKTRPPGELPGPDGLPPRLEQPPLPRWN